MTPAVEALKRAGVAFELHTYDGVELADGDYALGVAERLGVEPERLFKTLVVSVDGALGLCVIWSGDHLDLRSLGKRAALAGRPEAERATGYVVGGISPLGGRTRLPVRVDSSALEQTTILVSAGRRGLQVELAPGELIRLTGATVAPLTAA